MNCVKIVIKPMNKVIGLACEQLLKEYCLNPLLYLREANIQSRLNQLLLLEYAKTRKGDMVRVKIASAHCRSELSGVTKKSQLELKLRNGSVRLGRSDIVILRDEMAVLTCA